MEIIMVGRSNVGKSSLIRMLTGKDARVGKRPGVTRKISRYELGEIEIVDMPGFGYMAGLPRNVQEKIKTEIVKYIETNKSKIIFAIEIVDARSFLDIAERWEKRGQIPVDIEMFAFLRELGIETIVAVNKIDIIYDDERDQLLDAISDKLGMSPPWRQWLDTIVPLSAKTGEGMADVRKLIGDKLTKVGKEKNLKYFKKF